MPGFLSTLFNQPSETPEGQLIAAAEKGKLRQVKRLLTQGVDVNATDRSLRSALSVAAMKGHAKVVGALLAAGAKTEVGRDILGRTALGLAAEGGHEDAVRLLKAGGADINAVNPEGITPLHYAVFNRRVKVAHALLDAGVVMSTQTAQKQTPLMSAILFCPPEVAIRMIEKGVDLSPQDDVGNTARDIAGEGGQEDIVSAIDSRIAAEAAARTKTEQDVAREAAAKEAAITSASVLQQDLIVRKPLELKR